MRMEHYVNFKEELQQRTAYAEEVIRKWLPEEEGFALTMAQAMNYSMCAGGKRLRPILLLDEATSALDSDTEKALLCNIRAMKNKTCLIVTHRPAALEIADEVIRVEKGVVSADKTAFKEQKSED